MPLVTSADIRIHGIRAILSTLTVKIIVSNPSLAQALRRLEEMREISLIATFEVVTNAAAAPDSNYDLSLIFDFKNMDDLNAYQKHPMHVEFGKFITAIRESRACIDYEF